MRITATRNALSASGSEPRGFIFAGVFTATKAGGFDIDAARDAGTKTGKSRLML